MGLIADLGRGPVGLDTVVFIYFIEEHPRFQLAAALSGGCSVYLTSDRALPRIPGLEILQVSDYAGAP